MQYKKDLKKIESFKNFVLYIKTAIISTILVSPKNIPDLGTQDLLLYKDSV